MSPALLVIFMDCHSAFEVGVVTPGLQMRELKSTAWSEWQGCGPSCSHCARVSCRHQLETPGHYSHLAAFYEDKKGVLHAGPGRGGSLPPVYWLPSIHRYMYPEMKITHPAGCMSQFIKFFGEQILILWKFALLRKRILIFSPPPVGVVCYRGN